MAKRITVTENEPQPKSESGHHGGIAKGLTMMKKDFISPARFLSPFS
jgi:hypothetical protein